MDSENHAIQLPVERLAQYCRAQGIVRLEAFGSVNTPDFRAGSDVDLLAEWAPDARLSLYDLVRVERELSEIIGRPVDLLDRCSIEQSPNWLLRQSILDGARVLYEAA